MKKEELFPPAEKKAHQNQTSSSPLCRIWWIWGLGECKTRPERRCHGAGRRRRRWAWGRRESCSCSTWGASQRWDRTPSQWTRWRLGRLSEQRWTTSQPSSTPNFTNPPHLFSWILQNEKKKKKILREITDPKLLRRRRRRAYMEQVLELGLFLWKFYGSWCWRGLVKAWEPFQCWELLLLIMAFYKKLIDLFKK